LQYRHLRGDGAFELGTRANCGREYAFAYPTSVPAQQGCSNIRNNMPVERINTLIIGGGQAGIVMSHTLSQRGVEHLVLERHRIAERWRSERWKGLRFQFPNWSVRLPDFPFPHRDSEGFATASEIVDYICAYAEFVKAPVRCGVAVSALRVRDGGPGFVADTANGGIEADNVVVATGPYQCPLIPPLLNGSDVFQLHANSYSHPEQLPPGAVLIIGSGASGTQIAEELNRANRRVILSVGHHQRRPRRYRGKDLMTWLYELGADRIPVEQRGPERALPLITGAYGGHTIDLRAFAAEGIELVGRLEHFNDGVAHFANDLAKTIAEGDATFAGYLATIDAFVEKRGLDVPNDPAAHVRLPDPPCLLNPVRRLDLAREGIATVIWATGYGIDFGWIQLPILNANGQPRHSHGVGAIPGIYFLGLPWLSTMMSSFLSGVANDAARLADHIAGRPGD
jgi:putative flavoprotein involved in K+ transport